jgi:hypothetical protein
MVRQWIVTGGVLAAAFVLMISAIRARPFDDHPLSSVLDSPGCEAISSDSEHPCWMGIVIGRTPYEVALDTLNEHPWVDTLYTGPGLISWSWSGLQPAAINAMQNGLLSVTGNGVARQMRLLTTITFGDIWLTYGPPDHSLLVRPLSRSSSYQIGFYDSAFMQAITDVGCPAQPQVFWFSQALIGRGELWSTENINGVTFDIYELPNWWRRLRGCRP